MSDPSGSRAVLVRAADAEVLASDPASVISLLADTTDTGGALTSNRSLLRDGTAGAPPHYHAASEELFFVLGGALRMLLGEDVVTLTEGDFLLVPRGLPHAFAPAPGQDADILVVFVPGTARFDYYRLLDRVHRGEATWQDVADSQERFDNHYVASPHWPVPA
ncbi:cupin domain-containing protein [Micromonospora sp. NPDC048909]|uniref:cupin domain-containing protein n=1 Tax=Micromonospora sp. NPDC048909 TaxID=3155643 RepID=UPI003406C19F